jgi:hypothetical protein
MESEDCKIPAISTTYPEIGKCLLFLCALNEKQFAFAIEDNCASTYYVDIGMLAKIPPFRYGELLQGRRIVKRRS